MKVFARYFSEKDQNLNFRCNTVLQFGDSWDVIGAAVLINPGSAKYRGDVDACTLEKLASITGETTEWHSFTVDPTMCYLEKIFNGWYVGDATPLNGVILLFNLFNLRNKNRAEALELHKTCKSPYLFTTETDIDSLKSIDKIYLGWGGAGCDHLRCQAEQIFNAVKDKCNYYLDTDFDKNAFYHPLYVNCSYKRDNITKQILKSFKPSSSEMTEALQKECDFGLHRPMSNVSYDIAQEVMHLIANRYDVLEKKQDAVRLKVNPICEAVVVAQKRKQHVYWRHIDYNGKIHYDNPNANYCCTAEFLQVLGQFGYEVSATCLGFKNMRAYNGTSAEDLCNQIMTEIKEISARFNEVLSSK